jgi:hypothetical protein
VFDRFFTAVFRVSFTADGESFETCGSGDGKFRAVSDRKPEECEK